MSESDSSTLFDRLMLSFRFWVAGLAIRFCGFEVLYWADAEGWEGYLAEGEPPACRLPSDVWRILSNLQDGSISTQGGVESGYFLDLADGQTIINWVYGTGITVDSDLTQSKM